MRELEKVPLHEAIAHRIAETEWFLGYDAGCSTCTAIEEVVREIAGGRIDTVSLRDPLVGRWREQALGQHAPWAPTLFRVRGNNVSAWTGKAMIAKLVTILGPRKAIELGKEVGHTYQDGSEITRRGFAKGLVGGLVAAGVLGAEVSTASANEYEPPEEPISEEDAARQSPCTVVYSGSITSATKVLASPSLTLRQLPCTDSTAIGSIGCGQWVERISYHDQPVYIYNACFGQNRRRWYRVYWGGTTGYIASAYTNTGLGYDPGCC